MNITDNISNPAKINQQAFFLESHQKLNSNTRPSPAEKNTGCFMDMLQRAKNIELNKINSVSKTQEIWKSLKIDTIRTSYTRMSEQLYPLKIENQSNFAINRGSMFYNNLSGKTISLSFGSKLFESDYKIENIDFYI